MHPPAGNVEKEVLLLAYPRSGSNWLRYILEFIYCKPTSSWEERLHPRDGSGNGNTPIFDTTGKPRTRPPYDPPRIEAAHYEKEDRTLPHVYHEHNVASIEDPERLPLIVLVRNYKECILRHTAPSPKNRFLLKVKDYWEDYYRSLKFYDKHPGPKLLFYYEDLIDDKKLVDVLHELNEFMSSSPPCYEELLQRFIEKLQIHREQSLEFYNAVAQVGGSHSDSKSSIFHSRQFELHKKQDVDNHFESVEPELYKKFLKRYKEGDTDDKN
jgi:hypothetical protein